MASRRGGRNADLEPNNQRWAERAATVAGQEDQASDDDQDGSTEHDEFGRSAAL